jgi:hypothetical protein
VGLAAITVAEDRGRWWSRPPFGPIRVHKLEDIRSADEATGDGDGHVISGRLASTPIALFPTRLSPLTAELSRAMNPLVETTCEGLSL